VKAQTTFRSPVAEAVDYTVFLGTPDEIVASYRYLTVEAPLMPITFQVPALQLE
jgi:alpha-D-xyloside xylohydrolase